MRTGGSRGSRHSSGRVESLGGLGGGYYPGESVRRRWSGLRRRASLNRKAPMHSPALVATWSQDHQRLRLNSWTARTETRITLSERRCPAPSILLMRCGCVECTLQSYASYASFANTFFSSPHSFSNFCNVVCAFPILSIKYLARIPVAVVRFHQRAESNPIIRSTCNSCSHASTVASAFSISFALKARS